jgi:hypothetical protein
MGVSKVCRYVQRAETTPRGPLQLSASCGLCPWGEGSGTGNTLSALLKELPVKEKRLLGSDGWDVRPTLSDSPVRERRPSRENAIQMGSQGLEEM